MCFRYRLTVFLVWALLRFGRIKSLSVRTDKFHHNRLKAGHLLLHVSFQKLLKKIKSIQNLYEESDRRKMASQSGA